MSYDRLTGLDASFLHLESEAQPMHVGSLATFEGAPFFDEAGSFRIEDAREVILSRLHLVPRFRKKLMTVRLGQGRPQARCSASRNPTRLPSGQRRWWPRRCRSCW